MKISKMHKATSDERSNRERLIELREAYLSFKSTNELHQASIVMKNCLSLVNDRIEYSAPIKLDIYYKNFAKSFMDSDLDHSGRFNHFRDFDRDYEQYLKWELSNDLAPRFYCKQWFSTVIGVLEKDNGMTLSEIEQRYYEYIKHPGSVQTTIYEYV